MRDTGEFNTEYLLREMFFSNSGKSGTKTPIFADCSFTFLKKGVLRVGIKPTVFSNWGYFDINLKDFRSGTKADKLKSSYRTDSNKGIYWFESMKE